MEKLKQYMLAGVSMLVGAFLPYLYSLTENFQIFVYIVSILCLMGGLLFIVLLEYGQRCRKVKYTVLLFVLDPKGKLLTLYNAYHKRLMIPCGLYSAAWTPNDAVTRFLEKQAGLKPSDYKLAEIGSHRHIDADALHPCGAQIEFITKHEKRVKLHYSFVYCLELTKPMGELELKGEFKSLATLRDMDPREGLFSDLLDRYKGFLAEKQISEG